MLLTSAYYNHSNKPSSQVGARSPRAASLWQRAGSLALGALALLAVACGASNNQLAKSARRVPIAHLAELPEAERAMALQSLPVILEVRKGDRFPLEVMIDSRLVQLHTEGSWTVEARETFYVLLREEGAPAVSEDGVDFDTSPRGSFGVGFDAQAGQPAKLRVALGWHPAGAPTAR